jgi:hypothetical protein
MQVSASPVSGFAPPLFPPLDEADHDAADQQQGASGNDSAAETPACSPRRQDQQGATGHDSGNDGGASARNPSWLSSFGPPPSGIAAQIRAQTCAGTQQNPPSTQTQTAQASSADKSSSAPGTPRADASGATATSANPAERDTIQPKFGSSPYPASLGGGVGRAV